MYMCTVHLNRTEKQFWSMKPRKLMALVRAHMYYNSGGENASPNGNKEQAGFIDQII